MVTDADYQFWWQQLQSVLNHSGFFEVQIMTDGQAQTSPEGPTPGSVRIIWNEQDITMSKAGWIAAARRLAQIAAQAWDAGERFGHQPRTAPLNEWFVAAIAERNACIKELTGADDVVQFGRLTKPEGQPVLHSRTILLPTGACTIFGEWETVDNVDLAIQTMAMEIAELHQKLRRIGVAGGWDFDETPAGTDSQ